MTSADQKGKNITVGKYGEEIAIAFLRVQRYIVLDRNYRCKCGELDIIAKDGNTIVFVEVKTRRVLSYGPPQLSVTQFKQRQISKAALVYLSAKRAGEINARFDVIAIYLHGQEDPRIDHIKNAFDLTY
ncbi:MAG TPA: YraN family protein [Geobacteraceae bacterium]|nr:YraN family protein [Geobacteraceae bacterium]